MEDDSTISYLRQNIGQDGFNVTGVLLAEAEALKYAGQRVRLAIRQEYEHDYDAAEEEEEAATDASQQQSARRRRTQSTAVPAKVVESFGFADKDAGKEAIPGRANVTISSVIFLISYCGYRNYHTVESFRKMWLNEPSTTTDAMTMQNYISYCSQGAARMTNSSQRIFAVDLPCTGGSGKNAFNFNTSCEDPELYGMMSMADSIVRNTYGASISYVKQRIAVLPDYAHTTCRWGGLAQVGCSGDRCYTWINAAASPRVFLHEMLHNFGLHHAGRLGDPWEYADYSCVMGIGDTCPNAAQLWRLSWALPLPGGDLNGTTLQVGRRITFTLPVQNKAPQSYVRIYASWMWDPPPYTVWWSPDAYPAHALLVSFRSKEEPFELFDNDKNNQVLIHSFNGTQYAGSAQKTLLRSALNKPNQEFRDDSFSGLVFKVLSISPGLSAVVSICRSGGPQEAQGGNSCGDGLDNDCDGLTPRRPPRPPPRPPRPPRPPPRPSWFRLGVPRPQPARPA
ncbi:zinc-containing metallo-protease [Volvox carteri f. nagariensis]|uniref:Zinc-containing metallo-protease n=1 Tax=Volvox carteri f. nagariensis TaxID=3068 RepID=D8TUV5_VOLCA|nr:zinc-containing metallo-protease [Volvox carteri f. nagariensis]EFJ48887.1 zinc-containing metallo-protease [Volvox carteri f. nagariensis]|eukprot:XP_002950219.1 zinc-containing metallo-protease [Volvox carteri f. nagariensis]